MTPDTRETKRSAKRKPKRNSTNAMSDKQELVFRNVIKFWQRRAAKFKKVGSPHAAAVLQDCILDLDKAIQRMNAIRALDILKENIVHE